MRLLPEKLFDVAAARPDACAIRQGGAEVRYAELAQRAAAVAGWLRDAGVGRGDRVALLCESNADYVAAYYGALLAGAAAVGLNTAARADDIAGWIAHSEASALFIDGRHPEAAKLGARLPARLRVLARDGAALGRAYDDFAAVTAAAETAHPEPVGADALAALIYTSGTTGRPKAVMLSHRNLATNTDSIVDYLQLSAADSIVTVLPFHYSYGNSVLHTHIARGARIVIEQNLVYPHVVVETMAREAVTGFAGVPSTFALLTARVQLDRYDLGALRYITQAGGPMSPELTERVRAALPRARLFVMYGQTEAAARLSYVPPERLDAKLGSVGIPIPSVELAVRTETGAAAPVGVAGDVWARGPNVMLGYWKDPEATRGTLVDGWLRTGDVGRLDADGYLYLDGRRSDIIKVGAHRVYPRDVEAVIEELPGVEEVAVVGLDDDVLGEVVKACIVRSASDPVSEHAVKAHCRTRLAPYKIPKKIEFLAALPKTSSGKVRRHLLTNDIPG